MGGQDKDHLLSMCKRIQYQVFRLCEQLEKHCTARKQKVSKSSKPSYTGIEKRLSVVRKILMRHTIKFEEATKKTLVSVSKK